MKKCTVTVLFFCLFISTANAARLHPEGFYVEWWCSQYGGEIEHVFEDQTRADCLLPYSVVEFDFADKWYEAVGQSLHYGINARRPAEIVLIVEDYDSDMKYLQRLYRAKRYYGLPIIIRPLFVDSSGSPYEVLP